MRGGMYKAEFPVEIHDTGSIFADQRLDPHRGELVFPCIAKWALMERCFYYLVFSRLSKWFLVEKLLNYSVFTERRVRREGEAQLRGPLLQRRTTLLGATDEAHHRGLLQEEGPHRRGARRGERAAEDGHVLFREEGPRESIMCLHNIKDESLATLT